MATMATQPWYKELTPGQIRGFFGAWLGWGLDGFDFVLITYVLTDIAKEFHLPFAVAATLTGATYLSRWFGGAFAGTIADRFGRKTAMISSIWLYSLGTFLCAFAWGYWPLFVFRLLVGLGLAGEYSSSSTYVIESWPKSIRNKASGFLVSAYSLGGLVASLVYAPIVLHFGWRALFLLGILPVLLTIYVRFSAPESAEWSQAREQGETQGQLSVFQLFSRYWLPVSLSMIGLIFCAFLMNGPLLQLMPTYLKSIGYNPVGVGQVMFIASLGAVLGYIGAGFLGDWIGTRRAFVYALIASLILVVPVFLIGKSSILLLGVLLFVLEFTGLGITGLWPKYMFEYFPTSIRGAALGTTYNIGALGGFFAPVWAAALSARYGLGAAMAGITFVFTFIVVLIIAFNLPGRISQRRERLETAPQLEGSGV